MKKILSPLPLVIIIGLAVIFVVRFLFGGNEDDWICVNSQWVKHGNPSAPMPQTGCGEKKEAKPGEFSNGQKYETYKTDDFEINYPYWPNIDKKNLLEPQNIKLALANAGCNFVVNAIPVPANTTFKEFTEKRFQEQTAKFISKIITKDIKENTVYIDGELSMGNTTLKSVSYGYFTSNRQSYGIGFIAEKSQFETACRPIINDVIASVKIK